MEKLLQRDYLAFADKNVLNRISLYWFTRGNVLSIDKQFVGLSFTKVGGNAFFPGFVQLLHLSFPRVVQQIRDIIVDVKFRVLQMFPGLIHH